MGEGHQLENRLLLLTDKLKRCTKWEISPTDNVYNNTATPSEIHFRGNQYQTAHGVPLTLLRHYRVALRLKSRNMTGVEA